MANYICKELMSEYIGVKVTPSHRQWLAAQAQLEQRSMNQIIRMLIEARMNAAPGERQDATGKA